MSVQGSLSTKAETRARPKTSSFQQIIRSWWGQKVKQYEFEFWSSLDSRYNTITIKAESKKDAIKEFEKGHPHKKYRLLDPLD